MRLMSLDVGTKTVGVAVSDELGITAQPLQTYRRQNVRADEKALVALMREQDVGLLVVGLPLNMNGTEGERAVASRKLGDALAEATGVTVQYWDERLTTVAANRSLLEADVSRSKRRDVVDQVAAVLILQGFLDSRVRSDDE